MSILTPQSTLEKLANDKDTQQIAVVLNWMNEQVKDMTDVEALAWRKEVNDLIDIELLLRKIK